MHISYHYVLFNASYAGRSFKFVTKARQRIEEVVEITPHGLGEISETEYFNFDVVCPSDHDAAMMDRSLSITPRAMPPSLVSRLIRLPY